jgi:hypothetical protein
LSELQIEAYDLALADLSSEDLNAACEKTLQTWTFTAMPPPAFIRNCAPRGVLNFPHIESRKPLSPEEAEKQWQEARARGEKYRESIHEENLRKRA